MVRYGLLQKAQTTRGPQEQKALGNFGGKLALNEEEAQEENKWKTERRSRWVERQSRNISREREGRRKGMQEGFDLVSWSRKHHTLILLHIKSQLSVLS